MAKSTVAVRFTGSAADLQRSIGKVNGSLASVGTAGTAAFAVVAAGVVAAGVGLFKLGESFDEQYDKIRVGTGATGEALKGLEGSFKNVLKTVPASFDDAGTAIADLNTRLGLTGKPLEDVAAKVLNLSRITGTDLKSNVAALPRVFEDWGVATEDQSEALDKIFRTTQTTGIGLTELATKVVDFGSPLRNLGFTFEDTLALFGKFEQSGVNTETVMAGMKQGLGNFAKAGKDPKEALAAIIEEIKAFNTAGEAMPAAIDVFGKRAAPDMVAAIREGKFELGDLVDTIENGSDTINAAAKDTESFGEKWTLLKNRVLVALEPLARKVFDGVGKAMDVLGPKIDQSIRLFERFKGPIKAVSALIGGLLTVAMIRWGIQSTIAAAKAVAAFVATQVKAVASAAIQVASIVLTIASYVALGIAALLAGAQMALAWLIGLGPIALVVAAVIAAAVLIVKNWDTIKAAAVAVWDWIKTNWPLILAILTAPIGLAVLAIVKHWDKIKGAALAVFNWLKSNWPLILAVLTGPFGLAALAIARNWNTIKSGATAVKSWVVEKFNALLTFFGKLPGIIAGVAVRMWNALKSGLAAVVAWVKRKLDSLLGPLDEIAAKIVSIVGGGTKISSAVAKAKSQAVSGSSRSYGFGGMYHGGGIVEGRGDVPILAEGGEGVFTKSQMKALGAGAAGGGSTNVVIRFDGASSDPIMRAFLAELRKTVRVEGGNVQVVLG